MLSTPEYYRVCEDVIAEIGEIFGKPRFFHLGYDEENWKCQRLSAYAVVRQGDQWWHDFLKISGFAERRGMRPWIWSDYAWDHEEEFMRRMPRSVLQSNWYYGSHFEASKNAHRVLRCKMFKKLSDAGFDQIPCGSNYECNENFGALVRYCGNSVAPGLLKGYLMAPWFATLPGKQGRKLLEAIDQVGVMVRACSAT